MGLFWRGILVAVAGGGLDAIYRADVNTCFAVGACGGIDFKSHAFFGDRPFGADRDALAAGNATSLNLVGHENDPEIVMAD